MPSLPIPEITETEQLRQAYGTRPWVEEEIWGHRLHDGQTAWLLFLEFLMVAEARLREGYLLEPGGVNNRLGYHPYQRMHLRNILFNENQISRVAAEIPNNDQAWDWWLRWMTAHAAAADDFSYLRSRFGSFKSFAQLVSMLRSSAVDSQAERRWTSRFVFPFGPSSLYEDVAINKNGGTERQYINFGRTGEILYLMLSRSKQADRLRTHLEAYLSGKNQWDQLIKLLQPSTEAPDKRTMGYLPHGHHPSFDRLGEDWQAVFDLGLPGFDGVPHLVTLGVFHIMLYQVTVAAERVTGSAKPPLICEIVAPRKTLVRELSAASYLQNNALSLQAAEHRIAEIRDSAEWQEAATGAGAFERCRDILEREVSWGRDGEYEGPNDPESLIEDLRDTVIKRHRQHVGNVHRAYGREAGLVSKRGTNRLRYAPTDALLKTLLFANVSHRMELSEFLAVLYERYGIVLGDREADEVMEKGEYDKKAFQANARRLEQRLASLGLLRRLSDGCAYVENPYR